MPLSFFIVPAAYEVNILRVTLYFQKNILRITYFSLPLHLIFNAKHDFQKENKHIRKGT